MNVDCLCSIDSSDWNIPPSYIVISGLLTNNLHIVSDSMWRLVIIAWRKDYWALIACTQQISDMMKGDSLNQLIAQFLQLWRGKKTIWSHITAGWLMFSTRSTAQKFIIQIILIGKCFSSYVGEISNCSQQWLDVWENPDYRTFLAKELLSQLRCSKKQKQTKKEVLNKVNELL